MELIIFDLETTGLSPYSEEIIQIAAVKMKSGRILEEESFSTFVNPGRRISSFITNYTGISNDHVRHAPSPKEALAAFSQFAGQAMLIAHNGKRFDVPFIRELRKTRPRHARSGLRGLDGLLPKTLGRTRWPWSGRRNESSATASQRPTPTRCTRRRRHPRGSRETHVVSPDPRLQRLPRGLRFWRAGGGVIFYGLGICKRRMCAMVTQCIATPIVWPLVRWPQRTIHALIVA